MGRNANIKILFKNNQEFDWNRTHDINEPIYIMNDWKEIIETLEFALKNTELFMKRC